MDARSFGRRLAVLAAAASVVLAGLVPSRAAARVGFGVPQLLTPGNGTAGDALPVVARDGRTAVFANVTTHEGGALRRQVWLGRDPDHLSGPAALPATLGGDDPQATAEPDGTIVACGTTTFGELYTLTCALARPGHGFGAPRRLTSLINTRASKSYGHIPSFQVTALADGRLALLASHADDGRHWRTALAFARARSLTFAAPAPVTAHSHDAFTPLPAGGLLHTFLTTKAVDGTAGRGMAQELAPHAPAFAPAMPFVPPGAGTGTGDLAGVHAGRFGTAIVTSVSRPQRRERRASGGTRAGARAVEQLRVSVLRGPGWAAPVPVRTSTDGFPYADVVFGRDRRPLAITQLTGYSDTDCSQQTLGRIEAGPLTGPRPQLLSNKHQLASFAGDHVLDDGTVLALWTDVRTDLTTRVEYAVRAPHAAGFGHAHPLPLPAGTSTGVALAGNGHHLLAAWITGRTFDGPHRLVVATTRTAPPFAPDAPRPSRRSRAPCN